jgi:hypothetical protein
LALLGGHANANTSDDLSSAANSSASAEDALNQHQQRLQVRSEALNKARAAHMKEFQAKYQREQQILMQEEIKKCTERGEYMAMFTLMKDQAAKMKQAMAAENMRFMAMHGQVWDPKDGDGTGGKGGMDQLLESFDGADAGGLPMVRPGDASKSMMFLCKVFSMETKLTFLKIFYFWLGSIF